MHLVSRMAANEARNNFEKLASRLIIQGVSVRYGSLEINDDLG